PLGAQASPAPVAVGAPHRARGDRGIMKKNSEKALLDRIKNFQKNDKANKKCADCGEVGPTYVNVTHGTFVSTTAAGILREFGFKIKGISMSKWTVEEVEDFPRFRESWQPESCRAVA
ncbi:unnamed protein product, partial [Prorocentrum cordatum]